MLGGSVTKRPVESVQWQDYRSGNTGMVIFYTSDPVPEIPIREIPEELDSPVLPEPNYETATYGLYGCAYPKIRSAFVKGKNRYLFFMTKYAGTNEERRDKTIVTGYYRIWKTAEVKKFHIRYCNDYSCLDNDGCIGLCANEVHFVSLQNSLLVDENTLKEWGYTSKLTRQTRIVLQEEPATKLLEFLRSKPNALTAYVEESKRLQPHELEEETEEEEDEETG